MPGLAQQPIANNCLGKMPSNAAHVPFQERDVSDDGSDDGLDNEQEPMIEKGNTRSRRLRGNPRTAIAILGLLLLASFAGNVVLLWRFLQDQDLDAISVKHTSEYCQ